MKYRFFTGSYTDGNQFGPARGEGIVCWTLDSATGEIMKGPVNGALENPTWVSFSPSGDHLVAVAKGTNGGEIHQFKVLPPGLLEPVSSWAIGGGSCHVVYNPCGTEIWSASYGAGEVARIRQGRELLGSVDLFSYRGSSVNKQRQESPHAHNVTFSPCGNWAYVCDLGTDMIWQHANDSKSPLDPLDSVKLPEGEGPRHMLFVEKVQMAYVIAELTGKVHRLHWDKSSGSLSYLGEYSSLPEDWNGQPSGAAIRLHPHLDLIYVSNRNFGGIACFAIGDSGDLSLQGQIKLEDPQPRDFNISPDGKWIISGGQECNHLEVIPIGEETGLPGSASHTVSCGTPVCIAWG